MTKKENALKGNDKVIAMLNHIMESELAGVVRYTHYSLMVFGYNRLPIISWLRGQADESLAHAHKAGELITHLGGHPSLAIGHAAGNPQTRYRRYPARVPGPRSNGVAALP